jgi:glutathione S-transferase
MSEFIVYGIPGSPFMRAVQAALEEKAAPYRVASIGAGEQRSESYRRMNPFMRIPVIRHGDFTLYETQAILRYIDAVCPGPALQPTDAVAAARMNQLIGINDWYVFPQVGVSIVFQRVVGPILMGLAANEDIVAAALPDAQVCVEAITRILGGGPFLAGEALSIADLMLFPQLDYFARTPEGHSLMGAASLCAWMERMKARPSMLASLPPEPLRQAV